MTEAEIRARFAPWTAKHARPAWKPVIRAGAATSSHFGGSALLAPNEAWPTCTCTAPMRLFLQLELSALPAELGPRGTGILQLFYCSRDDGECETWQPFSGTHVVRLFEGPGVVTAHPAGVDAFPAQVIDRWEPFTDAPHPEEHEALGLHYDYDFKAKKVSVRCDELGLELRDHPLDGGVDAAESIGIAQVGDKLGGWPYWVQGAEYPNCPECNRRMELFVQLDSEDHVPYLFGDMGCGHVTQCPEHRGVLAFGWACA